MLDKKKTKSFRNTAGRILGNPIHKAMRKYGCFGILDYVVFETNRKKKNFYTCNYQLI